MAEEMQPPPPPGANQSDAMRKREKELAEKEAALMKREREIRLQEERTKANFPREFCCIKPMVHHDIEQEIPTGRQGFMRSHLAGYYAQCCVLLFNVVTSIAAVSSPDNPDIKSPTGGWSTHMGVSIVHLLGIPGAFVLWYFTSYTALKTGKSSSYFQAMLGLAVAFFYNLFMCLGIEGYGASGWLFALQLRDEKTGSVAFIMVLVNALAWSLEIFYFVWAMKKVHRCQNEDKATSIASALAGGGMFP